jgi:hypothetical protein
VQHKLSFLALLPFCTILFVPEPKSRQPNGRRETILCFPEGTAQGRDAEAWVCIRNISLSRVSKYLEMQLPPLRPGYLYVIRYDQGEK